MSNRVLLKLIESKQLPALQAAPAAPWEIPADALEAEPVRHAVERARAGGSRRKQQAADRWTLKLPTIERVAE